MREDFRQTSTSLYNSYKLLGNFKLRKQLLLAVVQQEKLSNSTFFPLNQGGLYFGKLLLVKFFIQRSDEIKILNPN